MRTRQKSATAKLQGRWPMMAPRMPDAGLSSQGIETAATLHWNLVTAPLVEHAVRRGEGKLAKRRPAGRRDRPAHRPLRAGQVHRPRRRDRKHGLVGQDQQGDDARAFRRAQGRFPGGARRHGRRCSSRICSADRSPSTASASASINELAWHNLFIRTMLVRPEERELAGFDRRIHDHRPAELPRRSRAPRHAAARR